MSTSASSSVHSDPADTHRPGEVVNPNASREVIVLGGSITDVQDISEEELPAFRVHALIRGQAEVFHVWLKTDHNEWAVYADDGFRFLSAFPTRAEAMSFIGSTSTADQERRRST